MRRFFKSVLIVFILSIYLDSCTSNTKTTVKSEDSLFSNNAKDSAVKPDLQKTIDTTLPPEIYKSKTLDEIGFELMKIESLGEIYCGMKTSKVIEFLGEPNKKQN